jgi:alanine racemase
LHEGFYHKRANLPGVTRTWTEVSLSTIATNFQALQTAMGGEIMAVVKADAYGHGLIPVARACVAAGAMHFGVATLDEARELRQAGISQEIYPLAPLLPEEAEGVVRAGLVPFVSSPEFFDALTQAARSAPLPARAVLALDTGMGREGMSLAQAQSLKPTPDVEFVGLSTHLSSADEEDLAPTHSQLAAFESFAQTLDPEKKLWRSFANSPGMLRNFPPAWLERAGAALYGIEPFPGALGGLGVRPALAWRARVTLVRKLPAGATVGYGRTATLARPSMIATIAVGYGDGLHRALGNQGEVLVRGMRCPMIGRVSMDQVQIDVTELSDATIGETVTLIGQEGDEEITAGQMAERAQTTCHAPTTMLTHRVSRRYVT